MRAWLKLGAVLITTGLVTAASWSIGHFAAEANTLVDEEGELLSGDAVLDDGSLYDQYTFTGNDGQYVTISLESDDFDPYLILLDPNGQRISENDDVSRVNRNSRLIVALPATGMYTAVANSYESGKNGEYEIKIAVASNRRGLSESLAMTAVPDSTAACSDAIAAMAIDLESGREVSAWVSALPLENVYSRVPDLRPNGVNVDLRGDAAMTVMSSPQLLTQHSARIVEVCGSVGAVVFDADTEGYERTFGFVPTALSRAAQGEAAGERVQSFNCARVEDRGELLSWGEQFCSSAP
ncbi:MAG: PPC domain-containing protein [Phormidesmis sp.]